MDVNRIRRRVEYLCSEPCAGREAGSVEGAAARAFLCAELESAGLEPIVQPVPGCRGANVIAHIGGRADGRAFLVGAHYDHIGRAMPPDAYWGADDNAAAVAAALELADHLAASPPAQPVIIALFDGEEPPYFLTDGMGSRVYCEAPSVPLADIDLAVVLDLVGHAVGPENAAREVRRSLFCLGAEKSRGTGDLVRRAARGVDLALRPLDLDVVPPLSDYEPFRRRGVPVLFLTGGRWRHYHETTDTPDRLDYDKIACTAELLARMVDEAGRAPDDRGRYLPDARDHLATIDSLAAICRALAELSPRAGDAADRLARLRDGVVGGGRLDPAGWSQVLQILALVEQGLA